ncbi:hypothetical protein Mgra_00010307, partial [Meloidogyne graminicola]
MNGCEQDDWALGILLGDVPTKCRLGKCLACNSHENGGCAEDWGHGWPSFLVGGRIDLWMLLEDHVQSY